MSNVKNENNEYKQWFTGPIITPTPTTLPPGHPGLELVLLASNNYGFYKSNRHLKKRPNIYGIRPLFDFQVGFNSILGAELIGSIITNFCDGKTATHLQDSIFRVGFQISNDHKGSWIPDFRILVQETLPTGKYQNLNVQKKGTDLTGQGSFQTGVQFVFQKLFAGDKKHPFRARGTVGYLVPSALHVRGLNFYGGDAKTRGTVYPGEYLVAFIFGEFALSRRWAIACEANYQQGRKGHYKKERGTTLKIPSFDQLSVLPEIQHTYNANFGVVIGSWLTISGKNSYAFQTVFGAALFLF